MPEQKRTARGVVGGLLGFIGLSAAAGVLVTAAVTPALAVTGISANSAIGVFDDLPEYLEITPLMEKSNIYAKDGDKNVLLASFYEQNRVEVQWDEISQYLKDAAIATEDNRYYEHGGIDLTGTLRALVSNQLGEDTQGGSSITQQYVKNVRIQKCERDTDSKEELTKCYDEVAGVHYSRKLKEMRYAIGLEKEYSKDEILRGYLNISGFGGVIYGVESAANYYFGTNAKDVTLAQAATIMGMVNNPNRLRIDKPDNPDNGEENGYALTKQRRDVVLSAMRHYGKITQEQYEKAVESEIEPNITSPKGGCAEAGSNAYFCDYVTKVIANKEAFGDTQAERVSTLKRGGLDIYTTLDLRLQKTEAEALHSAVPSHEDGMKLGGTATSIEPGTGRILAMVQNTAYSNNPDKGAGYTAVNFNTDKDYGGSSGFQPGSTWKTMVLVEWLLQGHSTHEIVNATRRDFHYQTCKGSMTWAPGPKNAGDGGGMPGGMYSVQKGTTQSINTVYAAMGEQLDLCDIATTAEALGAHSANGEPLMTNSSSLIGSGSNIAPLAMANAYATLAAKGKHCEPRAIDKIVKADGSEMEVPGTSCDQAIPENVAATAVQSLTQVMTQGTGRAGNPYAGPLFGKTGTTDAYKDTWLATSTTEVANVVWVGNLNSTNFTPMNHKYLNGAPAHRIKFGLTQDIVRKTLELYGGEPFPEADKNLTRRILKNVPDVVGQSVEDATQSLKDAGFGVTVSDTQVDSTVDAGMVASTDPGGGARVNAGSSVTINVSNGKGKEVPDVTGQSYSDAKDSLADAGFTAKKSGSCEPGGEKGDVAAQDPGAGSTAGGGATITLTVYCGNNGDGDGNDDD